MSVPDRLSYVGEIAITHFGMQRSEAAIYRIEHRAPNLTRRWYLAPQGLYGDSVISRGDTTFSIDVKRERVIVAQDDAVDDQVAEDDNFGVLSSNYRPSFAPDETVDGRLCHVILLTNKYTGETTMRLCVDAKTGLVLEKEQYSANGSLLTDTRFRQLRYVSEIPMGIFEIPKGLKRVDGPARSLPSSDLANVIKTAGFKALGPKYLPEGFIPVEGDVIEIKGVRTLHLLYSDGIRTVSLFQNQHAAAVDFSHYRVNETTIKDRDAQYVEEGATTLVAWSDSDLHFTLVGELPLLELQKIAASVTP
jgi:negative regulator of sigma E activity